MRTTIYILAIALFVICTDDARATAPLHVPATRHKKSLRRALSTANEERMFIDEVVIPEIRKIWWLWLGKSVRDVKQILKLEGLTGNALKSAENYKHLEAFKLVLEARWMNQELDNMRTSHDYWLSMNLNEDSSPESDEFQKYLRYAALEDERLYKKWSVGSTDDSVGLDSGETETEVEAKVKMWLALDREQAYVRRVLGIDYRNRKKSQFYDIYERFGRIKRGDPNAIIYR